jgi:hypothetical protein
VARPRPTRQRTNQTILYGDPNVTSLYIYINKFKPGRFGLPHFHPNDRFITVIDGAGWRGTGTVIDPERAVRLPKCSFSIDHALKVHWDGTKEENSAYLIAGYGPATKHRGPERHRRLCVADGGPGWTPNPAPPQPAPAEPAAELDDGIPAFLRRMAS